MNQKAVMVCQEVLNKVYDIGDTCGTYICADDYYDDPEGQERIEELFTDLNACIKLLTDFIRTNK